MITDFLENLDLDLFKLKKTDFYFIEERRLIIKKWNWEYDLSHKFQTSCVEFIQKNPDHKIFIGCNHPEVLTHGRGLQKPKKGEALNLTPFDLTTSSDLPYPLFHIERGGGLTFHHTGQFIFYPILKLSPQKLNLSRMTQEIFQFCIDILQDWGLSQLSSQNKLMGLWYKDKKIASMGIAIEKLTTFHGMALNLFQNKQMMSHLAKIRPCGLDIKTYLSVDELISLSPLACEKFADAFFERIIYEW